MKGCLSVQDLVAAEKMASERSLIAESMSCVECRSKLFYFALIRRSDSSISDLKRDLSIFLKSEVGGVVARSDGVESENWIGRWSRPLKKSTESNIQLSILSDRCEETKVQ